MIQVQPSGLCAAPPLVVSGVTKRFTQGATVVEALRNVSVTIEAGEFIAIMGASGSGKSTLLHVMTGLTRADEGVVQVEGRELATMSDRQLTHFRRRRIGLVFQSFNLIPTLTAEDNILLPLLTDGRSDEGKNLGPLLDRLGLSTRRTHRPDALSGGEQQRVAIARAMMTNPAVILADEPTGSLDSVTGQTLCRILHELNQSDRRTIVVVTHEPSVAIWAQRVLVMKDGAIVASFPTSSFQDPQSLAAHYQQVVSLPGGPSAAFASSTGLLV